MSLKIRNIIANLANGFSQVTLDKENYQLITQATYALHMNQPVVTPFTIVRNSKGTRFDKFELDGVVVMHNYNSTAKPAHQFFVKTTEATSRLETMASITEVVEFDLDSANIGGYVTGRQASATL